MSHWAEIDENNIVIRVLVGNNDDPNGDEGYKWLIENLGGRWVQTSYNANFRKKYAGIGDTYNEKLDAFISQKIYNSWVLDEEKAEWVAPIQKPDDGNIYFWSEETISWIKVDIENNDPSQYFK